MTTPTGGFSCAPQNAYTRRFNTRHREWGRLFGDRYKAVPTEGREGEYYCALADYLHLNPARAGLAGGAKEHDLLAYPWSSLAAGFAVPPRRRARWLAVPEGLAAFGRPDTAAGRRAYVERLERRAHEEPRRRAGVAPAPEDARRSHLRRGWYWGSQAFMEKLLGLLEQPAGSVKNRSYRSAPMHRTYGEAQAERLLADGLRTCGLTRATLLPFPGTDPRKVELAHLIWSQTTVSQAWIAEQLGMSSAANVSQILRRRRAMSSNVD